MALEPSGEIECGSKRFAPVKISMQLVEHHRIDRRDPRSAQSDAAAFAGKNLHDGALYVMRQQHDTDETLISYGDLAKAMRPTEQYKALPAKAPQ
jgi:putative transposase